MITKTISWSPGSCPNKSLNTVEPPVPPHHPGDLTAFPPRHHSVLRRNSACRSPVFPRQSESAPSVPSLPLKTYHIPLIDPDCSQITGHQCESTSDRFLKYLPPASPQTHSVYKKTHCLAPAFSLREGHKPPQVPAISNYNLFSCILTGLIEFRNLSSDFRVFRSLRSGPVQIFPSCAGNLHICADKKPHFQAQPTQIQSLTTKPRKRARVHLCSKRYLAFLLVPHLHPISRFRYFTPSLTHRRNYLQRPTSTILVAPPSRFRFGFFRIRPTLSPRCVFGRLIT